MNIHDMVRHVIDIAWDELSFAELSSEEQAMCKAAQKIAPLAYAPYSGYHVGAAVFCQDGTIVPGLNQENYCYSPTLHAEMVACSAAAAMGKGDHILKLACLAGTGERFIAPCGLCLITMAQYEQRAQEPMVILFGGLHLQKIARVIGVKTLMPLCFLPSDLGDSER